MSDQGVRLTERFAIMTDARTVRALLTLIQRVPMTDLEAVAVEDIFGDWFAQLRDQAQRQQAAFEALANIADRTPDQSPEGPPTLEEVAEQLDQIGGAAAGDVLTREGPPDNASGLMPYEGDELIVG
jgi:hypothetical protein